MGIAANAISDLIAPPPRANDAGASATDDANQPSFSEHLQATDRGSNDAKPSRADDDRRADRHERPTPARANNDKPKPEASASASDADTTQATATVAAQNNPEPQKPKAPGALTQLLANLAASQPSESASEQTEAATDAPENTDAKAAVTLPASTKSETAAKNHGKAHAGKGQTQAQASQNAAAIMPATAEPQATAPTPVAEPITPPVEQTKDEAQTKAADAPQPDLPQTNPVIAATAPQAQTPASTQPKRDIAIDVDGPRTGKAAPLASKSAHDGKADGPKAATLKFAAAEAAAEPDKLAALPTQAHEARANDALPLSSASVTTGGAHRADSAAEASQAGRTVPVAAQIGREIIRRSASGSTRFEMRLDPPELGRVDVRLEVTRDHRVTAVFSADNPQALSDLSRNARDLQQALQSAGLDLADDGLSFDLSNSQNQFAQSDRSDSGQRGQSTQTNAPETGASDQMQATKPLTLDRWRGSRVDLVA